MRLLPPLADRLREEASSLLLDNGFSTLEATRYLDNHNAEDTVKPPNDIGVDLRSEAARVEGDVAGVEQGDGVTHHSNPHWDNDAYAHDTASLMSDISAPSNPELQHISHDSEVQEHLYPSPTQDQDDLDMDDSDGGAPLYGMTNVPETIAAMLDSDLDAVVPSLDEDDSGSAMDTFDSYLDNPLFQNQSSHEDSEPPEDESLEASDVSESFSPTAPIVSQTQPPPDPLLQHPAFMPAFDALLGNMPAVLLSAPNPFVLGSENLDLVEFLRDWARLGVPGSVSKTQPPDVRSVLQQAEAAPAEVTYDDLKGDRCDFQGLDWTAMGTTRRDARVRRRMTYRNHVNRPGSDKRTLHEDNEYISSRESFFRFKKMKISQDVTLGHFQLRSVLACPSATKAYYTSPKGVMCYNSAARTTALVLNTRRFPGLPSAITTLDADHGVLLAGTFNGDYMLQSLHAENNKTFSDGQIGSQNGIVNHMKIYTARTNSSPVAAIASNDQWLQIMDLQTERLISSECYPFPPNCSAISPDRRLRVIVGDYCDFLVTDAERGQILHQPTGHLDYGFACDWSDDGWTVATAFQDKGIKVWDARRWCNSSGVGTPIHAIRSDLAGVRSLRFSPVGSGRNVLVAAEEADFINIIDAQSYRTKQTVDIFGEIGGIAFANDGQDLNILSSDSHRGGLLQLERCGRGPEPALENNWSRIGSSEPFHSRRSFPTRVPAVLEGLQPF